MWSRCTITSRAQISMSTDCPCAPPCGWWMRMREWGSVLRFPGAPAARSTAAADAACPTQVVSMSALTHCIVS